MRISRSVLAGAVLAGTLALLHPAARAQDPRKAAAPPVSEQEVKERLLELQAEIERLLPFLSPELRREIAAELARRAETQKELAERAIRREPGPESAERSAEPAAAPEAPVGSPVGSPVEMPAETAEPSPPTSRPGSGPTARTDCNTLEPFDTLEDGRIDSGDRYWRYLYLWTDANADGEVEEREVRSVYEAGIRNISVRLDRFEGEEGSVGLVRIGRWVVLDPRGDGFSGDITGRTDDGALTVDASALGRSSGPRLLGPDGRPLEGMQPLRSGLSLREASGRVIELTCPR
jgi:hypothetical protein